MPFLVDDEAHGNLDAIESLPRWIAFVAVKMSDEFLLPGSPDPLRALAGALHGSYCTDGLLRPAENSA